MCYSITVYASNECHQEGMSDTTQSVVANWISFTYYHFILAIRWKKVKAGAMNWSVHCWKNLARDMFYLLGIVVTWQCFLVNLHSFGCMIERILVAISWIPGCGFFGFLAGSLAKSPSMACLWQPLILASGMGDRWWLSALYLVFVGVEIWKKIDGKKPDYWYPRRVCSFPSFQGKKMVFRNVPCGQSIGLVSGC